MTTSTTPSVLRSVAVGLAAGAVSTVVKGRAEGLLQPWGERLLPPSEAVKATRLGADPADHPANMPPAEMADRAARAAGSSGLDDDQREQASQGLHWAMGLGAGVAYALAARRAVGSGLGAGVLGGTLGGGLLFALTHGSGLPLAGLQAAPTSLPRAWWVWEGGSHLVYGATLGGLTALGHRVLPG